MRFGVYAIYSIDYEERIWFYRQGQLTHEALDRPIEIGIFYNLGKISSDEFLVLQQFTQLHDLQLYEKEEFISKIFYLWIYLKKTLCIEHNWPSDLSRMATRWGEANGKFYSGFWLCFAVAEKMIPVLITHLFVLNRLAVKRNYLTSVHSANLAAR